VIIKNARIVNSVIRKGVTIDDDVEIENSIIMDNAMIRKEVRIKNSIIDKWNVIKKGTHIGFDDKQDRFIVHIDESGLRVMPRGKDKT
jgi:glucose-1-phosphate adenylyltransferase